MLNVHEEVVKPEFRCILPSRGEKELLYKLLSEADRDECRRVRDAIRTVKLIPGPEGGHDE